MPNLGLPELIILLPILLFSSILPIASFVLVFLTYRKVSALEQHLSRSQQTPPAP
jgi:hypothetical protein